MNRFLSIVLLITIIAAGAVSLASVNNDQRIYEYTEKKL